MSKVDVQTPSSQNHLKSPTRPGLLERWVAVPLFSLLVYLYGTVKRKSPYLETVFCRGERVFLHAKELTSGEINFLKPQSILQRTDLIPRSIVKVKKKLSRLIMSSKKVVKQGKMNVIGFLEHKAGYLLRSLPGRVVVWSVDRVSGVAESALFLIRPDLRRAKKGEMRNGHNGLHSPIKNSQKPNPEANHSAVYGVFVVFTKPLELLVYVVQGVQNYLHRVAGNPSSCKKNGLMSPEKVSEIQSRRKVSPRKKIKTGLVNQLQRTVNYFGLNNLVPGLRRKFHIDISGYNKGQLMTSPNKGDEDDKKRKYEDILSESESDSDDDLQTLDLDQYVSDEDPDFKPGGNESTDSEEYKEGDTESDIEFETTIGGTTQVKVRTKSVSKDKTPSAKPEEKGKSKASPVVDSTHTKEQTKTSPLTTTQPAVVTPPKSSLPSKPSILKSSTPKPTGGKENAAPNDSKIAPLSKKTPEPKHGLSENTDKKSDAKNSALANGDKKAETKNASNGGKKGSNGDKK